MYLEFYGLKEEPFNLTPDSNFLYLSEQHRKALSHLKYGIEQKKGFISLTGEVGSGKTTVCRAILKMLDKDVFETALILNSFITTENLLKIINEDLGISSTPKASSKEQFEIVSLINETLTISLNKFLFEQKEKGKTVVIIIDECQSLSFEVLEQLRMLSNLETEKEKLLQIVLIGQPEFLEKLSSYELRQLNQRITVRAHLAPLKYHECRDYIMHRLKIAGSDGSIRFTEKAISLIYKHCSGIPRRINVICDYTLIVGYVEETRKITKKIVKKALKEIQVKRELTISQRFSEDVSLRKKTKKVLAYAALFMLVVIAGWFYRVPVAMFWQERYNEIRKPKNYSKEKTIVRPKLYAQKNQLNPVSKIMPAQKTIVNDLKMPEKEIPASNEKKLDTKKEEDIDIQIKGDISIEDIPEGKPSSEKKVKGIIDKSSISAYRPPPVTMNENNSEFLKLPQYERGLWLLLSAWGIDYNLNIKSGKNSDHVMKDILQRFDFVSLETWEDLDFLINLNLPFAAETKLGELWVVCKVKDSLLSVKIGPGKEETMRIEDFQKLWKGRSIVLMENGAYTLSNDKTYFRGDDDPEIMKLKKMLKALGYTLDDENSFYDTTCENMVKKFQKSFLFYSDGTVGTETILMLYSRFAKNAPRLYYL